MSELPKASDHLKATGWVPVNANAHPHDTEWVDPFSGDEVSFMTAYMTQKDRDDDKKAKAQK
jgi:hypothetical protein